MTIEEKALKLEKEFQEATGSHWEIRNGVAKLLRKHINELKNRYIDAHCNPDFKGDKMQYIFGDDN